MISAIIVAAGKGTRMGPDVDKLFLEVAGKPLVAHTWTRFDQIEWVNEIVVVVRKGMQPAFEQMAREYRLVKPFRLAPGGAERQDSVWNGLAEVAPSTELVLIQDGARPCTTPELVRATLEAARASGAAVAAQRVTDTIKESDGGTTIVRTVDRARLWAVQTPQAFRLEVIRDALRTVREKGLRVTDDTAACEATGHPVRLVESFSPNPKATTRSDLAYIELCLTNCRS